MKNHAVSISPKTILFTIATLIVLYILYLIKDILMAFFLSLIIMSALNPGVRWLESRKVPRPLGILILYLLVFGALGIVFSIVIPPLGRELSNLVRTLQVPNLPSEITQFRWTIDDLSQLLTQFGQSINSVVSLITSTFSGFLFFFTILVMSFYLLLSRKTLHENLMITKDSRKYEGLVKEFIDNMEIQLGGWVRGQLVLMLTIGSVTWVLLTLLGVPYALPLAVLAGFLEILPNLGPTIAAVPAIVVALLFLSPTMAGIVTIMYITIQQVENNILVPRIMKSAVNVEPLTSILAILIGFKLGNVFGALLAIPIYIVARSAFHIYLRENGKE